MTQEKSHREQLREQLAADLASGKISSARYEQQMERMAKHGGGGGGMGTRARFRQDMRFLIKLVSRQEVVLDAALARLDELLNNAWPK